MAHPAPCKNRFLKEQEQICSSQLLRINLKSWWMMEISQKDSTELVGNEIVLVVPKNGDSPVTSFSNLAESEKSLLALRNPYRQELMGKNH